MNEEKIWFAYRVAAVFLFELRKVGEQPIRLIEFLFLIKFPGSCHLNSNQVAPFFCLEESVRQEHFLEAFPEGAVRNLFTGVVVNKIFPYERLHRVNRSRAFVNILDIFLGSSIELI